MFHLAIFNTLQKMFLIPLSAHTFLFEHKLSCSCRMHHIFQEVVSFSPYASSYYPIMKIINI